MSPSATISEAFSNFFGTRSRLSGPADAKVEAIAASGEPQNVEDIMSAKAVIHLPGEAKGVTLAGQPLGFLVTGDDTRHTSMFDWTIPARFSTGLHVHRVQEET